MFPGNFQTALEEFDQNDDGLIDFDEFQFLNRTYPLVLFPAFQLQDRIQRCTLGSKGWVVIQKRVAKSKYLIEYMRLHGGELPPESFFSKLGRCFAQKAEVKLAMRQQMNDDEEGPGSPKGSPKGSPSSP